MLNPDLKNQISLYENPSKKIIILTHLITFIPNIILLPIDVIAYLSKNPKYILNKRLRKAIEKRLYKISKNKSKSHNINYRRQRLDSLVEMREINLSQKNHPPNMTQETSSEVSAKIVII